MARMAQNIHRTEVISMFEKNVYWCNFCYKMLKNITYAGIRARYLFLHQILLGVITKQNIVIFFEIMLIFGIVSGII